MRANVAPHSRTGGSGSAVRAAGRARDTLLGIAVGASGALVLVAGALVASPLTAVLAVTGLAIVAGVMLFPTAGLVLTALVVPVERFGRFGEDDSLQLFSLMRVVGTVALAGVLLHMALRRWRLVLPAPILLYVAFIGLGGLSLLWADDPAGTRARLAAMLGNLLCLFLFANGARDWPTIRRLAGVWLGITGIVGLYQLYDWNFGIAETAFESDNVIRNRFSTTWESASEQAAVGTVRRAMGTTSNAAVYGINLIMTIPFFLWYAKMASGPLRRGVAFGGLVVTLYNMMLTNTRAVMIFGALTLALCAATRLLRVTIGSAFLALGLAAAFLAATPESVWRRVLDITNYTVDRATNLQRRFEMWEAVSKFADDHWLLGVGVGSRTALFPYLHPTRIDHESTPPHNAFLMTFVELGLPGVLLIAAFLIATCVLIQRTIGAWRADPGGRDRYWFVVACQISVVTTILFGIQVDVFHFSLKGWWMVVGLACALRALSRDRASVASCAPPHADANGCKVRT